MRRTPYITQSTQGFSAIVNEIYFSDGQGGTSYWIPEEAASEYITYSPQIIARQNGVTVTPEADAAKSAKVEVATNTETIVYKYRITENGNYYIPDIMTGKEGIRKVVVDVKYNFTEQGEAYKNGEYYPDGDGFKSFFVKNVRKAPSWQPQPGEVYPDMYIFKNGHFTPPEGYIGVGEVHVAVEKDSSISAWTNENINIPQVTSCAAVSDGEAVNIFWQNRWFRITFYPEKTVTAQNLPFSPDGMAAFMLDGEIHLVGSRGTTALPMHKIYNGTEWVDGSVQGLPQGMYMPNIVNANGEIFIVGAGTDQSAEEVTDYAYNYDSDRDEWINSISLAEPVYSTMDAIYFDGGIHVWYPSGTHIKYEKTENQQWIIIPEETSINPLFDSTDYKLLPSPSMVSQQMEDKILMINAANSERPSISTIASCTKTENGYVYKNEGFVPYNRFFNTTILGFGQNALIHDFQVHVFGAEGGTSRSYYTGSWQSDTD